MGGCRCTFRECTNNSINSPGKHFFHFPFKDNDRCKKWALNSNNIPFLNLPWTQLRNKTVCEDHFIGTCFMNYKKERLTKTAVPSIYRTKDGKQHELILDEDKMIELVYNYKEMLNDEKAIDLPNENTINVQHDSQELYPKQESQQKKTLNFNIDVDERLNQAETTIILNPWNESEPSINKTGKINVSNNGKPTVLNRSCQKSVKRFAVREIQEKAKIRRVILNKDCEIKTNNIERDSIDMHETIPKSVSKTYSKPSATMSPNEDSRNRMQELLTIDMIDDPAESDSIEVITNTKTLHVADKTKSVLENEQNKIEIAKCMEMMAEQTKKIDELSKLLTEAQSNKKPSPNQMSASISSSSSSSSSNGSDVRQIRIEKGPAMTKVQLFTGIRKYLNPSMIALLRMEMFGSADRDYRPDEKQFSKELYNLNQNVYDYMRDEWRFRLPPKSDVETWLKDPEDEEIWELC